MCYLIAATIAHFAQAGGRADFIDPSVIPPGARWTGVGLALGFVALVIYLVEIARPGIIGEWWEMARDLPQRAVAFFDRLMPDSEPRKWR